MEEIKTTNKVGSMETSLFEVFTYVTDAMIRSKSALIGLCSEIDRFLMITMDIDMSKDITDEQYNLLFDFFPNLSNIPYNLLDSYFILIRDIRNISAHIFLANKLQVDFELLELLYKIAKPLYKVESEGNLTFYGCAYILSFIAQKYQTWPFITLYFNKSFIECQGNELAKRQVEINHHFQTFCGANSPVYPENSSIPKVELIYLNDLVKRTLTKIFFKLERLFSIGKKTREDDDRSFKHILEYGKSDFSNILIKRLNALRNFWFHGTMIYDKIVDEYINEFNLQTISEVLLELIEESKADIVRYNYIIKAIRKMGSELYDFCGLRLVEVSYKLLDYSLYDVEKIEERITNSIRAFNRLLQTNEYGFLEIAYNLNPEPHKYYLAAAKFTDKIPRPIKTSSLKIYKIHSERGIKINDFHSEQKDVYICLLVDESSARKYKILKLNKICDKNILDLEVTFDLKISQTHEIYNANIE